MSEYMLLFSLGPVQSFIAQARKTRDLWLGSFLLSLLMEAAMKGIKKDVLVFPTEPTIVKNIPDLPNKYIAIFSTSDEARQTAEDSIDKIETCWREMCQDVWDKVLEPIKATGPLTREIWDKQTHPANFFEIFWVVVAGTPENYKQWLAETQAAFDGRKRVRNFRQQEEPGEKSTISGEREALRGVGEWRSDVQTFWYEVAQKQSTKDIAQDGTERLDAIDTVKRFAHLSRRLQEKLKDQNLRAFYPSTSSIATASFVERLIAQSNQPSLSQALQQWLHWTTALKDKEPTALPFLDTLARQHEQADEILLRDGDCYFPETFTDYHLKKDYGFGEDKKASRSKIVTEGTKALLTLRHVAETLSPPIARPTSYYAMIQMDGDKMGTLLSGVKDKDEHTDISRKLSAFSRKTVPAIVEEAYPGRLIYAGGDDVFALAPLARDLVQEQLTEEGKQPPIKTVIELANHLQQQYVKIVKDAVKDDEQPTESRKKQVTASVGIAIAHHYTALSFVRRMSKAAEDLAKNHYGRDALVVTVLRRSGEQTRVGCHWKYPDLVNEAQPILLFSYFYGLFKDDILSPKCVYSLLEEVSTLIGLSTDAQQSEIKRVLQRQRSEGMKHKLSNDEIKTKAKHLVELAEAMDTDKRRPKDEKQKMSVELHSDERRHGLVEVLGWLLVMVFLARKEQD